MKLYEANLGKFITELRKSFSKPNLPIVILGAGVGGKVNSKLNPILKVQLSVSKKLSNVTLVDTRPFWSDKTKASDKSPERWHSNPESFYKMGEAAAKAFK